jgi:hypothetical protein
MDDLAPAPTQRTYDDVGRVRDENFRARKRPVKKVQSAPPQNPEVGSETAPEPGPELDTDHELDLLA